MRRAIPVLAFAVFALGCHGLASPVSGPNGVSGAEAKKLVSSGALLLDVRTPEEFADGHIEGAQNVPLGVLEGAMSQLPKNRTIVVYCQVGGRATAAAQHLAASGFDVRNLGAMANWNH